MKRFVATALLLYCALLYACAAASRPETMDFQAAQTVQAAPTMALAASTATSQAVAVTPAVGQTAGQPAATPAAATPSAVPAAAPAPLQKAEAVSEPEPAVPPYPQPAIHTPKPSPTPSPAPASSPQPLGNISIMSLLFMQYVQSALARAGIPEDAAYSVQVTYHSGQLLSCLVQTRDQSGGAGELVPVTIDLKTGDVCRLSDFFSKDDTGWKGVLPDIVTNSAHRQGLTLLCEVPPVTDDQPFFIEDGSIVLLYRPYEITTYEAGAPRFVLPMQEIRAYLSGAYGIGG